ncbi:sigma-70 family RNA polymerase sigma factor [Vicingaceae bacterium]|nr:sigma-70 family RNA polymerase sigma factor [Vicingaceae bacterium]
MELGQPESDPPQFESTCIDKKLAESLFLKHRDELSRFLTGVLRNSASVADVLQSTFTTLIEKGGAVEPSGIRPWLFRVGFNQAMLTLRRSKNEKQAMQGVAWQPTQVGQSPLASMLIQEKKQLVRAAIEQLSVDQKQIIRMRIYEGKKFADIAKETGEPIGTLLSRMRAALKRLNTIIGESNIEE